MYKQFEVLDSKRDAVNVWLSPTGQYAIISDALSRVMCLDLHTNLILHMWKGLYLYSFYDCRYRDVQCVWTHSLLTDNGRILDIPILLLFSDNRCFLEGYRIPSFSRVFNKHFPYRYEYGILWYHSCLCLSCSLGEFIVYDVKDPDGIVRTKCDRIQLKCVLDSIQNDQNLIQQHDLIHKNSVIRLLKKSVLVATQSQQCTEIMSIYGKST